LLLLLAAAAAAAAAACCCCLLLVRAACLLPAAAAAADAAAAASTPQRVLAARRHARSFSYLLLSSFSASWPLLHIYLGAGMSEVITASPNEEEAIRLDEFRRVRLQRLLQVRDAERQRAKSIRCTAEEQVALAKGDLKAKVTREVTLEFRQAMQSTRQRLRSAETSVGESFAAAQQHQEVLAVEARADYEALSRSVHVAAQRHQAAVQVEAAISSESPGAVARQRAQRMTNVRQEAAQESVSWASSRPPVQPKLNELPKPAAARRHKPADASAFHTSHHHFGSGLLYPHSAPNIHVVRHPRSSADTSEVPTISPDESTLSATATAPVSTRNMTPDVGRRALANQHSLAHPLKGAPTTNTSENELFARAWPQPRGMSPSEADDDHPNPLPAPQPRSAPAVALNGSSSATISSLAAIQPRSASPNGSLHHQQRQSHAPHPIHYTVGQFVSSAESSFAAHTASRAATAPAALPLNLVSGDGRLTMSATDIAQRIAELHRVRAIQEEAKLLKQEATIMNRGRNAAAYLRERSEATNANAAVEQLIKETEQSRRQAARVIAPPPGSVTASGSVPENVREKAFERLLFQPAAPKDSASVSARMRDSDAGSRTRNSGKEATASDSVAQPLPSSLSLRGAILRDSSVSSVTSGVVIADVSRERAINVSEASVLSPSKQIVARAVAKPVLSDSDSSSDSLEQSQQQRQPHQQPHSSSSSDSDDLWPPQNSRHTREMPLSKKSSLKMGVGAARAPVVQSSHKNAASNADDVLMSDSSSSSSSLPSSPVRASRTSIVAPASPKAHISLNSHQLSPDTYLSQLQQQHQSYVPHLSQTVVSSLQLSSAPSNIENNWPPSSPPAKPAPAHAGDQRVRTSALLSPQSRISKKLDTVAPLRSSAPASLTSNASNLHPEHSTSAPSPTRAPVSPAHARVRILIPTVPLSPEPAAVIRSPPSSNISTPSDLQSPSLLQRTNILRDLRLSPSKGASFYQQNSSFGEAASLAAMDDYNVRGSTDEQLDTRLSTDTWMRLSAARSSIASLERDLHERKLGTSSTLLPQAHSETVPVSESSDDEEDFHESIANAGQFLILGPKSLVFFCCSLLSFGLQEILRLTQFDAPLSASATMGSTM
jgi:hypothetical protein